MYRYVVLEETCMKPRINQLQQHEQQHDITKNKFQLRDKVFLKYCIQQTQNSEKNYNAVGIIMKITEKCVFIQNEDDNKHKTTTRRSKTNIKMYYKIIII